MLRIRGPARPTDISERNLAFFSFLTALIGGALATFFVHACQEGANPLVFLNNLLENIGNRVEVPDTSPGSQPAAKLLTALKLTGPLRDLFFEKGTTNSTILKCKKAVIEKCANVDSQKLHKQIQCLKKLDGAFSLIDYKKAL